MSKPREWWIKKFDNFFGECDPDSDSIHVIEKSAYDLKVRQLEIAMEAFKRYATSSMFDKLTAFYANKTIAEIKKLGDGELNEGWQIEKVESCLCNCCDRWEKAYNELKYLLETIVKNSQYADTRIPAEFIDKIREMLKRSYSGI